MFYIASKNSNGEYQIEEKVENWHDAVDNFEPIDCIDGGIIIYNDRGNKFLVGPRKELKKTKSILGVSMIEVGSWNFEKGEPFLIDTHEENIDELNKLLGETDE